MGRGREGGREGEKFTAFFLSLSLLLELLFLAFVAERFLTRHRLTLCTAPPT